MTNLKKYFIPVPRYTSYPTVPFWDHAGFSVEGYERSFVQTFTESDGQVSLYVHLPFCESLCTYCACNTRITKNHDVEDPYITHVLREWQMYKALLPTKPIIREVHLGGGTPTFFSPENLDKLMEGLFEGCEMSDKVEMSFEGHPANTTVEHLDILYRAGFRRVSFGIQDFDETVQRYIHRHQSFEQVKQVTDAARQLGYTSVNYDIVYGLPGQTEGSLLDTLHQIGTLSPDRIAYYSYAHVPTMRPAQRVYEQHLPDEDSKFWFMQLGKECLTMLGYEEVGMDHFVKPTDDLVKARKEGRIHRNFMGYTTFTSRVLIGLGVSAISDCWGGFAQNEKRVEDYYARVNGKKLPLVKGHILNAEDLFIRQQILNLMCHFETSWSGRREEECAAGWNWELLRQLEQEGFVRIDNQRIEVLADGKQIIRIVCSALDMRMLRAQRKTEFSQSI